MQTSYGQAEFQLVGQHEVGPKPAPGRSEREKYSGAQFLEPDLGTTSGSGFADRLLRVAGLCYAAATARSAPASGSDESAATGNMHASVGCPGFRRSIRVFRNANIQCSIVPESARITILIDQAIET
jgi:hypothetical protein